MIEAGLSVDEMFTERLASLKAIVFLKSTLLSTHPINLKRVSLPPYFDACCDMVNAIIPFSTVVDREKARRCPFYAPSGFLYEIGNVVWAIYPEIFLNFLFRTLGR